MHFPLSLLFRHLRLKRYIYIISIHTNPTLMSLFRALVLSIKKDLQRSHAQVLDCL
jgi:hypothetical protein